MKLLGTGVAVVTPFKTDLSIDFAALAKVVEHLIGNGVDYLVVLGTTGETATLTKEERKEVWKFVVEKANGRVPIVFGIGGNNTQEIVNTIKSTDYNGVSAILSVTPYYNKPNQRGLYAHYQAVAESSPLPVILYNVPGRTGVNMTAETTLKLAHDFKNIVAVKEASGNMEQIAYILRDKPADFAVVSGDDGLALAQVAIGCSGVISVYANAFPKQFSEMINLGLKGDFNSARSIFLKTLELTSAMFAEGSPAGVKAVMAQMGLLENVLRLPLVPVSENSELKVKSLINKYL